MNRDERVLVMLAASDGWGVRGFSVGNENPGHGYAIRPARLSELAMGLRIVWDAAAERNGFARTGRLGLPDASRRALRHARCLSPLCHGAPSAYSGPERTSLTDDAVSCSAKARFHHYTEVPGARSANGKTRESLRARARATDARVCGERELAIFHARASGD